MAEEDNPLTRLPGYMLRRVANAMMAELAGRLEPTGLRISDATLLMLVEGRKDMTASRIARTLDIQRANMVPILARIEEKGLIEREPLDGKSQAIVLTEAGMSALAKARAIIERFESQLIARVPDQHRDHLLPALHALAG
jgi:DNA-binding MarR family transcriptional regulator